MKKIYLDNASTSFPKPKKVAESVFYYMTEQGSNINRGCYDGAYAVEEVVFETRQMLCELFHGENCKNVVFTKNVTESINIVLKGFLKSGDHVLVSSVEHNAVMRPLVQLEKSGVTFTRIPNETDGSLSQHTINTLGDFLRENTKVVIMTHASNVCGTLLPIEEVGKFCKEHDLILIVDCAQTAGVYPIDMEAMNIDVLCFTGHKGLLGPQGIGGFILKEKMIAQIEPLISGGTGSLSHTENIPTFMPDRFEPGTMNLPGIVGLREGLLWLQDKGLDEIRKHELKLTGQFLDGLSNLENQKKIRIIGKRDCRNRLGVVSIQTLQKELSQAAFELDNTYGIMTRVGLHCAPSAHKILQTYPVGTIRFSFGYWNTEEEITYALHAVEEICHGL